MLKGGERDITDNRQGQDFTSYLPKRTLFKGLCPMTVGRTVDGTADGETVGLPLGDFVGLYVGGVGLLVGWELGYGVGEALSHS